MSGLLETFYFLFTSDAKALDKGLQDSEKANKKLSDSILNTDKVAKKLGENLTDVVKKGAAAAAGILAFTAIKSMIVDQANFSDQMAKTALQTRMSTENLSAYSRVVVNAGGDANAFAATLERLGEHGRNPIKMLDQLRSRFQGLSQAQALRLGKMMGLDVGTIEMLTKTKAELAALIAHQKELGTVTKEDADAARAFNNQLHDTGAVYDDIKRKISTALMPAITGFFHILERMLVWLRDNKTFVLSFFGAVAAIVTAAYLPAIVAAATATYALIAPFLLIGAAVVAVAAAFALAYDDVQAFLDGNNSVIGELAKKWPWVGELVHDFANTLLWLKSIVADVFAFIVDCFTQGPAQAFTNLANKIVDGADTIKDAFPELYAIIKALPEAFKIVSDAVSNIWQTMVDNLSVGIEKIMAAFDKIKSIYDNVKRTLIIGASGSLPEGETPAGNRATPQQQAGTARPAQPSVVVPAQMLAANSALAASAAAPIQQAASHPMAAVTSNAISNSVHNNGGGRTIKVDVGGVTIDASGQDPDKLNASIASHLENAIKAAINHHDDGLTA